MTNINGVVYLIIGLAVSIMSWFLGKGKKGYMLFFYAGLLLALIGLIKVISNLLRKNTEPPVTIQNKLPQNVKTAHTHHSPNQQPTQHAPHHQSTMAGYCSRCGNIIKNIDNFCSKCGDRIFRRR